MIHYTHTHTDSESVSYHNTASFFSGMVAKWLVKFFNLMAYLQWRDAHYSSIVKTELWILQKADAYIPKCCSSLSDQFFQFTSSQLKRSELFVGKTKLTFSNAVGDTMLLWPALSVQHNTLSVKIKFSHHEWEFIDPWRETPSFPSLREFRGQSDCSC